MIVEPKLVIIESPYAGEVDRNVSYARRAMKDSLGRGEHPIASHLLYTLPGVLDDNKPEERKRGIEAGFAWWEKSEMIVFYLDYGVSPGMVEAMLRASKMGKMVDFRKIGENEPFQPINWRRLMVGAPCRPAQPPASERNQETPPQAENPPGSP